MLENEMESVTIWKFYNVEIYRASEVCGVTYS